MDRKKIVITGIGAVSSVGIGADTFFSNLAKGISGIGPITHYDASPQASRIAGQVTDFSAEDYFSKKFIRRTGRYIQMGLLSAQEAVGQARLDLKDTDPARIGCLFASGIGDFPMAEEAVLLYHNEGPGKMSPFTTPRASANMVSANISIELGLKGPSLGVVSACTSGSHAVALSAMLLQAGLADVIVTGGAESTLSPAAVESYIALRALSTRNDDPQRASRPFDKDRDGGACLKTRSNHPRRGRRIWDEQ